MHYFQMLSARANSLASGDYQDAVNALGNKQLQTLLITVFQQQGKLQKQNEKLAADYKSLHNQNKDLEYK